MFNKRQQTTAVTVIAGGTSVDGTVRARGVVQVDGRVVGNLQVEGHVCVGPEGVVEGEVHADDLSVGGRLEGTALVKGHLHVLSGGAIEGEVRYGSLEVSRGGVIDGRTARLVQGVAEPANDVHADAAE